MTASTLLQWPFNVEAKSGHSFGNEWESQDVLDPMVRVRATTRKGCLAATLTFFLDCLGAKVPFFYVSEL